MAIRFSRAFRHLAIAASVAMLAACGEEMPQGDTISVGVLTDSPIQGVEYLTSSTNGITNSAGEFRYKTGDTIIFKLGALSLGVVTGTGNTMTVTPLQLIEGITRPEFTAAPENAVTNLLVLLQSLDSDGDPSDGIQIPAAALLLLQGQAFADTLFFALPGDPATFATSPQLATLVTAINTAGGSAVAVTPAAALAHFRSEFLQDLAGQYYGVIDGDLLAFRFRSDGSYLMTQIRNGDAGTPPFFTIGGQPGLERGIISWNATNGRITASTAQDSNDVRGFSDIDTVNAPLQLGLDGGDLIITERNNVGTVMATYRLDRLLNNGQGGTWTRQSNLLTGSHFFLLPNGLYIHVDPEGNTSYRSAGVVTCGGAPGVELGSYAMSLDQVRFSAIQFDSTGCAGVYDTTSSSNLMAYQSLVDNILQWGPALGGLTLYRPNNNPDT